MPGLGVPALVQLSRPKNERRRRDRNGAREHSSNWLEPRFAAIFANMRIWPAFLVCLVLGSCGSKGAVSLTVYSSNEAVTVQTSPFGGGVLDGVFQLEFLVGG